jgi:hypothetical protein
LAHQTRKQGLLQFKHGWAVNEEKLNYYKYNLKKGAFIKDSRAIKSSYGCFKTVPVSVLRFTGNRIYLHVG